MWRKGFPVWVKILMVLLLGLLLVVASRMGVFGMNR
jgi:hypothetical protein